MTRMVTESELSAFIARHRILLLREREEEVERSSLLLSKCGPKLLEQKGLALSRLPVRATLPFAETRYAHSS